jgi:hypothetical protein
MSFEAYEKLLGVHVLDRLAEPGGVEDIELVVPGSRELPRPAAFE